MFQLRIFFSSHKNQTSVREIPYIKKTNKKLSFLYSPRLYYNESELLVSFTIWNRLARYFMEHNLISHLLCLDRSSFFASRADAIQQFIFSRVVKNIVEGIMTATNKSLSLVDGHRLLIKKQQYTALYIRIFRRFAGNKNNI